MTVVVGQSFHIGARQPEQLISGVESQFLQGLGIDTYFPQRHRSLAAGTLQGAGRGLAIVNPPSDTATARLQEAIALHQSKQYADAATICDSILDEHPNHSATVHMLGLVRSCQGDVDTAIALIEQAIVLDPNQSAYHHNLGGLSRQMGHMEHATRCFVQAIHLKPDYAESYQALAELGACATTPTPSNLLVNIGDRSPSDSSGPAQQTSYLHQWLMAIEQQLARCSVPKQQSYFHFAAAKLCDRLKDYDRAFEHYRHGNQKVGVTCDLAAYRTLVTDNLYIFTSKFQTVRQDWGVVSDRPIFVVGMPRSGTTLVEHILASHPHVFGAGELPDIYSITQTLPTCFNPAPRYPLCMELVPQKAIVGYANGYLNRLTQIAGEAPARVVNKNPLNFLYLGFIFTAFPNAKVVHLQRDARDTCLSCFQQNFSNGVTFSFDLFNLGAFYRLYQRLMGHWSDYRPAQILHLQYEDLVSDPEAHIRRLLDFCGLDWEPKCLEFHRTKRAVATASVNQVRQPLYRSSVGRWKRYEAHLELLFNSLKWGDVLFDAVPKSS